MAAFEEARAGFEAEGLVALPPTPFTSSNEVAVRQETADELGLKTISDLDGKSQDLTLYGSPECRQRLDCLLGLQQVYGLKFKKFVPVDVAQRHEVLSSGRADVSIVFTTDPQIQREQEVLLEDDKGMFPPYNSTLVLRKEVADEAGESLTNTVELIQEEAHRREHAGGSTRASTSTRRTRPRSPRSTCRDRPDRRLTNRPGRRPGRS